MSIFRGRPAEPAEMVQPQRCDRCPAPARVRATKHVVTAVTGSHVDTRELDLVLCNNHFGDHAGALRAAGWRLEEAA